MADWKRRETHLNTRLKALPRRLRKDAEDLIRVFLYRKSLRLRLSDAYLQKIWECSRATVQRRLESLEKLGFLRRMTSRPRNIGGKWEQIRQIFLLVSQKRTQGELRELPSERELQPSGKSARTPLSFQDYLCQRDNIPLKAFMFWMRKWDADPRSMPFLAKLWKEIRHRPDTLESVLWSADEAKLWGRQRVGFIVSEIRARTCA